MSAFYSISPARSFKFLKCSPCQTSSVSRWQRLLWLLFVGFHRASSYDSAVLAVVMSACLSVTHVLCDKTKQCTADKMIATSGFLTALEMMMMMKLPILPCAEIHQIHFFRTLRPGLRWGSLQRSSRPSG